MGGQSIGRKIGGGSTKRGEIIKQVMKEQGLSLPQASKYVKENNLYQQYIMFPKYQNTALDGENRAKKRVIKSLAKAYLNENVSLDVGM